MGYSYDKEAGPKMCFNAAKLWQLGWNSNRHLSLSSSEPFYIGDLAGFVDDPDTPGSPMIIKIDDPSGEDYFINFNVKADFNSGTKEGGDEVLVIRAGDGVGYAESQLKAKLGEGSSYTVFDFDDGKDLLVQVLSINTQSRIANIRVCIGECPPDCTSNAQCDDSDACTMDSCVEGVCSNSPRLESELCGACPAGERVLDIRVLTDRYPQETSWTLRNKCTDTIQILEAQNSDFTESATEYGTGQICVPKGEYEFTINDAYGDGICCNYGKGSFSIVYNGIAVSLVEESDFAFKSSKTIEFGEVCSQNIIPRCVDIDRSGTTFCQGVADDISQCSQARGDDPSQMISSLCPITCGVECTKCYDVESYQHKKITKDCDWAKRNNKCTKSKFMAWCPKMCGVCQ